MAVDLRTISGAGDTENMTSPVNKSRLQEMYNHLRVNRWPDVTDLLKSEKEDPEKVTKTIKGAFKKASDQMDDLKKSIDKVLQGNGSERDLPEKVQEYRQISIENLQMALFHRNKQGLYFPPEKEATKGYRELVSEFYWLGCLMALNNPPLQPNWDNHRPGMDAWDILPRQVRGYVNPECTYSQRPQTQLDAVFMYERLEEEILSFVKDQLKRFSWVLTSDYPECLVNEEDEEQSSREAFLKITLDFLRRMDQSQMAEQLQKSNNLGVSCCKLKSSLQKKFSCVFEGIAKAGNPTLLNQIYTELYITEGGTAGVNQEHEVRHIETASRKPAATETTIICEDIFKGPTHRHGPIRTELTKGQGAISGELSERTGPIRTVLTKGVAGIGKTVLTQKFSLDWAEGRANQDIQLLFPFTFRELNVLRDRQFSLMGLLHHFFSESKGLCSFQHLQVVFIFDGLDECRLPLDFTQTQVLTEATKSSSVDVLLVNLIRGTLLPSARIWITTRPAAANQIPAECVSMVTEVRGFTDLQKEQYFKKRFNDEQKAIAIISHIKTSRSLHIMCHIPIFCWIISTVLHHVMKTRTSDQLPQTLTQMYIHFLVVQAKVKGLKYDGRSETDPHWTPETRNMVESLGKLAFEQLQKGNLIFYESDLIQCGLEPTAASVYSGVFTQVFREEPGLYQDKVYCFIHLSVQEFLAALHVHLTFFNSGVNLLLAQQTSESPESEATFYCFAVDQALQSPNGHLDMFLRFLLGLSLPTNQSPLRGLLTQTGREQTNQETVKYIKEKLNKDLSAERSMNLFHCLNELNDRSLVEQIQQALKSGRLSRKISPAEWSAVAFLLLSSDTDEFDLKKYCASEEALQRLMAVVRASNKAILSYSNLSKRSCSLLSPVLSSESSNLTLLDFSNNDLQDSGVKSLCSGLKSTACKLKILRLSGCLVSEEGGHSLASALSSAHSHLRELDLSYNHLGPSAELLTTLEEDPHCPLDILSLKPDGEQWLTPGLRKYFRELTLDPNTANSKLILSNNNRTVKYVNKNQPYPDHPSRFNSSPQVLCSAGLTGRCYWEVDWMVNNGGSVYLAVSDIGITKGDKRNDSVFGENQESGALKISSKGYYFSHGGKVSALSHSPPSSSGRVAVYVDHVAGLLSFYEVCVDKLILLHTFYTTFTQPLFAGFGLHDGSVSLVGRAL